MLLWQQLARMKWLISCLLPQSFTIHAAICLEQAFDWDIGPTALWSEDYFPWRGFWCWNNFFKTWKEEVVSAHLKKKKKMCRERECLPVSLRSSCANWRSKWVGKTGRDLFSSLLATDWQSNTWELWKTSHCASVLRTETL